MKIALVAPHAVAEFAGGTERAVRALALSLSDAGHAVRIVAGTRDAWAGHDARLERDRADARVELVRVPRMPSEHDPAGLASARVLDVVERTLSDADVVHVHHWSGFGAGLVRRAARVAPVVLSLHDAHAACPTNFRTPRELRAGEAAIACPRAPRQALDFAACARCVEPHVPGAAPDAVARALAQRAAVLRDDLDAARALTAPSAWAARAMERALGRSEGTVQVLPPRVDVAAWAAIGTARRTGRRAAAASGPLRLLHIGHLSRAKGILDLVQALATLPPGTVRLDVFGGALEPDLDALLRRSAGGQELALHGPYDLSGAVEPSAELPRAALAADLAALPSRLPESHSLALDELLACGLPTWVSDRGALPERLQERGMPGRVLPAQDVRAWGRALSDLVARREALDAERERAASASLDVEARARAALEATLFVYERAQSEPA